MKLITVSQPVQLVECPRDAMQGWPHLIPTQRKIDYLNALLRVGFHTLDCGSFVSPKAIPQMADTAQVIPALDLENTATRLLVIVANKRGAEEAVAFDQIHYLGFPFSLSETFQQRNTNSSIEESLGRVEEIQNLCLRHGKELVVYLSMGFGNPYGDPYNEEVLLRWTEQMVERKIGIISFADTVGLATPQKISFALDTVLPKYPQTTIGVHLHSTEHNWEAKLSAAIKAGCVRIDGALKGIGGCPMAGNELVGNMNTENIISFLDRKNRMPALDADALQTASAMASTIFS